METNFCIKVNNRTAKLIKDPAILADRYSVLPINIDSLYSVELWSDGQMRVTRQFDEMLAFLRGEGSSRDLLSYSIGFEVQLAVMAARLRGNSRVLGEDVEDDEVISKFFTVDPIGDHPRISGCLLTFTRQYWRSPDSLIGECERVTIDLDSGRVVQIYEVPLRR
jgi:hypothetical protein